MPMLDDKFTLSIQQWVQTPPKERDVAAGAEMLFRLNRNRWLWRNACSFPERYNSLIEHELKKHLRIRLDGLTQREVVQMESTVVPQAQKSIDEGAPVIDSDTDQPEAKHRGKRADHDSLPEDIRGLYEENGDIYFRMKQVFATLKGMADQQPCDRYEHLQMLKGLDDQYRKNWETYDNWTPKGAAVPSGQPDDTEEKADTDPMAAAKALSAARKYVSEWAKKLESITDEAERAKRVEGIQERVDLILANGGTFKPDFQQRLEGFGVTF